VVGDNTDLQVTDVIDMAVGDYVELIGYQTSGAALNCLVGEAELRFDMTYIGPGLLGRGVQNLSGIISARPAVGTVPQGTTYFATDTLGTWLSDGTNWVLVNQRAPLITSATMSAAPFTTPYDGQEIILTDSITAPTYTWHLKYNANDASAYKWEFVGGSPFISQVAAGEVLSGAGAWTYFASGPDFVVPRSGEYVFNVNANVQFTAAGIGVFTGICNASIGVSPLGTYHGTSGVGASNQGSTTSTIAKIAALSTGQTIRVNHYQTVTGQTFSFRVLTATPVRVA
jgi:hypothetical protein